MVTMRVGRYMLFGEIASGGMAAVHYGRQRGGAGFARIVAIKRLHAHLAKNEEFRGMFLDEARIAARVRHANVAGTIDVVEVGDEVLIVMDYIAGESLSRLLKRAVERGEHIPVDVATAIMCDVLHGLHAAHEARDEQGTALGIVHRDISPQNVIVGSDGIARLVDFGVAKAAGRMHETVDGRIKGKLGYMAPEQLRGKLVDRRSDVYAAGVVLWETLVGRRLFVGESEAETVTNVLEAPVPRPSTVAPWVPTDLDNVVLKAVQRDPAMRYATARDMASALESSVDLGTARTVGSWVHAIASDVLDTRARLVAELEREPNTGDYRPSTAPSEPGIAVELEPPRSSFSRRALYATLLAAVVAVATALGVAAGKRGSNAREASASSSGGATPSAVMQATAQVTAEASATPNVTASPSESAPPATEASLHPTTSARHVQHTAAPSASSVQPANSQACPVKAYTAADGIVRFRPECPR